MTPSDGGLPPSPTPPPVDLKCNQDPQFSQYEFISTQILENGIEQTECILPMEVLDSWSSADQFCRQFNNGEGRLISIHRFLSMFREKAFQQTAIFRKYFANLFSFWVFQP